MNDQRHATAGRYILVVDDDKNLQQMMKTILTDAGYKVELAGDGEAALQVIAREQPSLILLDMYTPTIDGWTFLALYPRTKRPHAPIIGLSASVDKKMPGVAGFLAKPFNVDDLLALVGKYMPKSDQAAKTS
jgi:CheY-like chemotaxis protein